MDFFRFYFPLFCIHWLMDYERDNNGNPVRDGSYTIQLFGTDAQYLHPVGHGTAENTIQEIWGLDRDYVPVFKWFITPARDGKGNFYIQIASDKSKYLCPTNKSPVENNTIEINTMPASTQSDAYKWKFEKVSIPTPLESMPSCTFSSELDRTMCINLKLQSSAEETPLSLAKYHSGDEHFAWKIEKNADFTYSVRRVATAQYFHLKNNVSDVGTTLDIKSYNPIYAPFYKWIVEPGQTSKSFRLRSVANPSWYMHVSNSHAVEGAAVDIWGFEQDFMYAFEWWLDEE